VKHRQERAVCRRVSPMAERRSVLESKRAPGGHPRLFMRSKSSFDCGIASPSESVGAVPGAAIPRPAIPRPAVPWAPEPPTKPIVESHLQHLNVAIAAGESIARDQESWRDDKCPVLQPQEVVLNLRRPTWCKSPFNTRTEQPAAGSVVEAGD